MVLVQSVPRLKRRGDFERVFRWGRVYGGALIVVRLYATGETTRVGVAVGKRIGCAVVRNRLRRRWREVVRLGPGLRPGFDVVIVVRATSDGAVAAALRRAWTDALERARLML